VYELPLHCQTVSLPILPEKAVANRLARFSLLYGVYQGGQPLDANLETIAGLDRANTARGAREDNVSRQERHIGGDEAHQLIAVKNQIGRIGVLP